MVKVSRAIIVGCIMMIAMAAWSSPVPDTGVTKCYDAAKQITCPSPGQPFYGQDANFTINPMSYTKLGANGNVLSDSAASWIMVKDNVTGLIWEMKTNKDGVINYNDPHDADNTYIYLNDGKTANDIMFFIKVLNDANYGGYSDWRLPTIQELGSIINCSIPSPGPTTSVEFFPETASSFYWSSTVFALSEGAAHWGANFYYGYNSYNNWGYNGYVRAVRGGDNSSYKDNSNGTVTDTSTGLMWQQSGASAMTWEESLSYCESLKLGNYSDWRLPTIKELRSIVEYSMGYWVWGMSINTELFPNTVSSFYWSSTTNAYDTISAWGINFDYGNDNYGAKSGSGYVRAVRNVIAPTPAINANGQVGQITVPSVTPVSIKASLSPGDQKGTNADWWVAYTSPLSLYSLTTNGWTPGFYSIGKFPLISVVSVEIFNGYLPAGDYIFYFAVDIIPNGVLDPSFYYDRVQVHVIK